MAASEVSEVEDLIWTVKCSRAEKAEADADAAKWDKLASDARIRANRALLQELSASSRLESLGVTVDEWTMCTPCRKGEW